MPRSRTNIVVGYDGSRQGRDALALARLLAAGFNAEPVVAVIHPVDRLMPFAVPLTAPPYDFEAAARGQADALAAEAQELIGDEASRVRVVGSHSPAHVLYDLAEELEAALVVVGSSHHAPVGRLTPGSVADALLSGSPCPVAVAPSGFADRETRKLAAIGVAYDASDEATRALSAAEVLAARLHATLTLVTASAGLSTAETAERLREATRSVDLLVCGSRGYGPVRRVLLGSVTSRLVRDALCPVLALPRGVSPPFVGPSDAGPRAEAVG